MKIRVSMTSNSEYDLVAFALVAAFIPFGCLTRGVDGSALAQSMLQWVNGGPQAQSQVQKGMVSELVSLLWSAKTAGFFATIELGPWMVSLRTPFSGTQISLCRFDSGDYCVEVGPMSYELGKSLMHRACLQIIANQAKRYGVNFVVHDG